MPEPFGPTSATCSPRSSANDTLRSSSRLPMPTSSLSASTTVRPLRAGLRNSKPSVRVRRDSSATSLAASACCFWSRPMWVSFACACFALSFLARKRSTKRSSRAMSASTLATSFCGVQRARRLLAAPRVPRPREEGRAAGGQLQRRGRHRLEEPAVVRDEDHRGVEREQLALEPLEAGHVEVVRRLVQQQQVGVAAERPRQGGARQLAAGERAQLPVEVLVGEAEAAQDRGRVVAPAVAARVLEARLRRRVAVERALVVGAAGHRLLEPRQLLLEPHEVARARQHVLAQRQPLVEGRALVVQGDARPLLERELAAVLLRLAGEDPEQRRLAGPVRPGERDPVAPLDAERDAVEEQVPGQLLAQVGCDHDCHAAPRVDSAACRPCSPSTSARPRCGPRSSTSRASRWTSCGRPPTAATTRTRSSASSAR